MGLLAEVTEAETEERTESLFIVPAIEVMELKNHEISHLLESFLKVPLEDNLS